jgi:hypothetical protein
MGPYAGKRTGETALLWTLLEHFKPGDVVIADRLYTSYFMISRLMQLGVDVVMRQHQTRHTDFRRGKRLLIFAHAGRAGLLSASILGDSGERHVSRE